MCFKRGRKILRKGKISGEKEIYQNKCALNVLFMGFSVCRKGNSHTCAFFYPPFWYFSRHWIRLLHGNSNRFKFFLKAFEFAAFIDRY